MKIYEIPKENMFTCKIGRIGADPQSYFVVIPKWLARSRQLKPGMIIKMAYIGLGDPSDYPFVNGVRPKAMSEGVKKEIINAEKLGIHLQILEAAQNEANYFLSIISPNVAKLTLSKSVAAVAIYVAAIKMGTHITQAWLAQFYGITTVTVRNQLRKGWEWSNKTLKRRHESIQVTRKVKK